MKGHIYLITEVVNLKLIELVGWQSIDCCKLEWIMAQIVRKYSEH